MTTPFPKKISGKTFVPLVMAAVEEISGARKTFRKKHVYGLILRTHGWTKFQAGHTKKGNCKISAAINQALKRLKDDNKLCQPIEGSREWALVREDAPEVTPQETPPTEEEEAPPAPEVEEAAPIDLGGGVSLNLTLPALAEGYTEEELRIASGATRCFGLWRPAHSECDGCPLARLCAKERIEALQQMGALLDNQRREEAEKERLLAIRAAEQAREEEERQAFLAAAEAEEDFLAEELKALSRQDRKARGQEKASLSDPIRITPPKGASSLCTCCKKPITDKTVIWQKGVGLFHESCVANSHAIRSV